MTVADLLGVTRENAQITLLTIWNYTVLAQDRKGLEQFKDVEIDLLTAGTTKGNFGREAIICAYVTEECLKKAGYEYEKTEIYEDED